MEDSEAGASPVPASAEPGDGPHSGDDLRAALTAAETERTALAAQLEQERAGRAQAEAALREAAERYRDAVLRSAPEVPPELVGGATVEEIDRALAAARQTVDAVRRRLAEHAATERVPAGAPPRGAPDVAALSPREKIALALVNQAG